ncbi:amidohydrolase family protein [Oceanidesulfovibrio indonesiensis]|nr:amidohydrolase [Oceanidesulfovibrio indonesiensis]
MNHESPLLFTARWVLGPEGVIENGCVHIAGGRILAVCPREDVPASLMEKQPGTEHRDLGEALILPGLVNAHCHAPMTLFRGAADDMELLPWLERRIWPLEAELTREITFLGTMLACAEMAAAGITCFADMYVWSNETARAVHDVGLRAVLSEGLLGFPTRSYGSVEESLALTRSFMEEYAAHPRISFAPAPHTAFTSTEEQLVQSYALSKELDSPWLIHAAETASENSRVLEMHGQRTIPYLDSLGCLGERAVLVHAVDLTPEEVEIIAARGAKIVHCPRSNWKLASGMAPVHALGAAGVTMALGTDGAASNNSLDILGEMRAAALGAKIRQMDPTALPAAEVLAMATRNGAAALRLPGSGMLKPGQPADLCVLNFAGPHLQPCHDPLSHAVYAAQGSDVCLTMVDGRIVYDHGAFPTLDYPALLEAGHEVQAHMRKVLDRKGRQER